MKVCVVGATGVLGRSIVPHPTVAAMNAQGRSCSEDLNIVYFRPLEIAMLDLFASLKISLPGLNHKTQIRFSH
jgi:hypothetical protein